MFIVRAAYSIDFKVHVRNQAFQKHINELDRIYVFINQLFMADDPMHDDIEKQYPVNFTPDGDTVAELIEKHINEIAEVYVLVNQLFAIAGISMDYSTIYTVNFTENGDTVSVAVYKHVMELDRIYSALSQLFNIFQIDPVFVPVEEVIVSPKTLTLEYYDSSLITGIKLVRINDVTVIADDLFKVLRINDIEVLLSDYDVVKINGIIIIGGDD